MKLEDLKLGYKVKHYCAGMIVTGTIIQIKKNSILTSHKPVKFGLAVYVETEISPPTDMQRSSNGDKAVPQTTYRNKIVTA